MKVITSNPLSAHYIFYIKGTWDTDGPQAFYVAFCDAKANGGAQRTLKERTGEQIFCDLMNAV